MDEKEQLRAAAALLLEKAQNATLSELASAVEKATGVLRLSSELEKSQAELRKLALEERKLQYENETGPKRERSERLKEYVVLITPVVTVITLAATLLVQGWQFNRSENDKIEAALDGQWEDTVKTISQSTKLPPGIIALHPFLNSEKYRDRAKLTAIQLLANSRDPVFFDDLFGTAFVPVGWSNLNDVLKLDRALTNRANALFEKTWDEKSNSNDLSKLSPDETALYDYVSSAAIPRISAQVGSVLKTPRPRDLVVDLTADYFKYSNWRGVDLSAANISNLRLVNMDLRDANLDKITEFTGAYFLDTAWWEAKAVSPELLEYLKLNYGYESDHKYGPEDTVVTPQQYAGALARLRRGTR